VIQLPFLCVDDNATRVAGVMSSSTPPDQTAEYDLHELRQGCIALVSAHAQESALPAVQEKVSERRGGKFS
jgi:hypothetical protein